MDRTQLVRRATPVAVFAVVLGAVVLVSRTSSPSSSRSPRALPINAASGARGAEDRAASGPRPAYDMAYWTETRIADALLAGLPTEGPAYDLTAADEARIVALAKALGIQGEPRKVEGATVVGTGDRVLQVMAYPGTPWFVGPSKFGIDGREGVVDSGSGSGWSSYGGTAVATAEATPAPPPSPAPPPTSDPEPRPSSEPSDPVKPAEPSDTPTDTPIAPDMPCPAPSPGTEVKCAPLPQPTMPPQPSDAEARAAADGILAAVGQSDAKVTLAEGWSGKEVTAAPVVGGLATSGYETRVTVDASGTVVYANGFLARPGDATTYPLLDPRKALERNSGTYGREDIAPLYPQPSASPAVREATAVRLGLMFMPSYDATGPAFLVPAWLLSFAGSTWEEPVLALPDEYIAKPPAPTGDPDEPVCDPSPCPTKGEVPPAPPADGGGTDGSAGTEPNVGTAEPAVVTAPAP